VLVRALECLDNLRGYPRSLFRRQPALGQPVLERSPCNILHRDVRPGRLTAPGTRQRTTLTHLLSLGLYDQGIVAGGLRERARICSGLVAELRRLQHLSLVHRHSAQLQVGDAQII